MSDQDVGKRKVEEEQVEQFIEEYTRATGSALKVVKKSERPDFICVRDSGEKVGLELTWVPTTQDDVVHDLYKSIFVKEEKRIAPPDWTLRDATILVLMLTEATVGDITERERSIPRSDFTYTGFVEIWAADYGSLNIYGFVDLFGLFPDSWWGHHRKQYPKPYG